MLAVALAGTGIQTTGSHPPPRSPTVKISAEDTKVTGIVKNSMKASLSTENSENIALLEKKEKISGKSNAAANHALDAVRCFKKQNQSFPQRRKTQTRSVRFEMLRSCPALVFFVHK